MFYTDHIKGIANSQETFYSDYFRKVPNTTAFSSMVNGQGRFQDNNNARIILKNTDYTSASDFKAWLSNNNVTVYYVLQNPQITDISDNVLINQLELLNNAKSYNNQTYISQADNILPFIITVDALKKND